MKRWGRWRHRLWFGNHTLCLHPFLIALPALRQTRWNYSQNVEFTTDRRNRCRHGLCRGVGYCR